MSDDHRDTPDDAPVVPLRTTLVDDRQRATYESRLITPAADMTHDEAREAVKTNYAVLEEYAPQLTARVAMILCQRLGPVEDWVGVIFTTAGDDGEGPLVEIVPRAQALDIMPVWTETTERLRTPFLHDRLDVLVEARAVGWLASLDVEPALPVTRPQAEALNLPTELLFAKGEAFASVREEPANEATLLAALLAHRELVEEMQTDLYKRAIRARLKHDLRECAGVILSLGSDGEAVTVLPRVEAHKLVAAHPFLARKLARPPLEIVSDDGVRRHTLPLVVWAKGHVSVQCPLVGALDET